ncbi:PREDICTED: 39S ribosomal protein L2, mitochondrial [Polistes dominula]|uniref:39S ribosomal protein L2, mitochondrial n=1 Tax=Polistes dominula TaxID=743375 RepID=A0ABM1HZ57_POLDO|nr:PREDICTED: 39S ribosomal protein L2, mitochondrial [Polistes dominula]
MSALTLLRRVVGEQIFNSFAKSTPISCQLQSKRNRWKLVKLPEPDDPRTYFKRIVHYTDEYTIEPLKVTNLGGRDPVTGRVVVKGLGGGIKHKYHWIKWTRDGPSDLNEKPKEERVLEVFKDGCRTSFVALVGSGDELKYILATENMKPGDIIRTHRGIPRNPVRANEGDAYPLGALPIGTNVCCVERNPGSGSKYIHSAGTTGKIIQADGPDRMVVQVPSKRKFSFDSRCMAVVGRLSNILHGSTPIGSAQKNRELGNRPSSGLWQRKTGRFGRKIKPPKKVQKVDDKGRIVPTKPIVCNLHGLS